MAKKKTRVLRPILPNAGNTAWYHKRLLDLIKGMQKSISWWVMAELKKGSSAKDLNRLNEELAKRWDEHYSLGAKRLSEEFIRRVNRDTTTGMKNAFAKVGFTVGLRDTPEVKNILNSLRYAQVDLIKSIPTIELDKVAGIVQRGVQNGRDIFTIQDELEKRFEVTQSRARFIAIDQNNKATQAIKLAHDREAGIHEGIWDHVPGRKTSRPTHVKMNGKRFQLEGIDKGLYDSAVGRKVMPGELPMCCCGYHAVIPD